MATIEVFLIALIAISCQTYFAAATVTISNGPYTASIAENAAVDTTVVTVLATTDVGADTVVYSLETQAPDTSPKIFKIDASSGLITVGDTTHLNFATDTEYTLTIKAAEAKTDTVSATTTVTVTATANKPPTFAETTYTACVNKTSPAGTSVVQVTATDVDVGDTLTYAITADGNIGAVFAVSGAGIIKVAADKTVSGTPPSYNLTLVATDDDDTPLSGTATVSVTVEDPCPIPTTAAPKSSAITIPTTSAPDNSAMTDMVPMRVLSFCVFVTVLNFLLVL